MTGPVCRYCVSAIGAHTLPAAFLIFPIVHHYEGRSLLQRCCNLVRESRLQLIPAPPGLQPPCGDQGPAGAARPKACNVMVGSIPSLLPHHAQQPAAAKSGCAAEEGRLLAVGGGTEAGLGGISQPHPIGIVQWLSLADSEQCALLVEHCLDRLFGPDCIDQLLLPSAQQQPPPPVTYYGPVSVLRAVLSCPPLQSLMAGLRSGTKDEVLRRVAGVQGPAPSIHQQCKELPGGTDVSTKVSVWLSDLVGRWIQ